jgi:hypothetical protein
MPRSMTSTITFGDPLVFASLNLTSGDLVWFGPEGQTAMPAADSEVLFIGTAGNLDERLISGRGLDSTAELTLPHLDLDSTETTSLRIVFLVDDPLVVMISDDAVPADLLRFVTDDVAADLRRAEDRSYGWRDLASGSDWLLIRVLRARIRAVEESVRTALADESISGDDYVALRDYPKRLALVERLWGTVPNPNIESHTTVIAVPLLKNVNPAEEARQASARLSGLISSQQVVLAQRQANETARFQRLITVIGAAVLVPGLVAAVFGANVGFRGRNSVHALSALLLVMLGSALGSYSLLRAHELGAWEKLRHSWPLATLIPGSASTRLGITTTCALAFIATGISILLWPHFW